MPLCHNIIHLSEHVSTYCMLERHHDGNCKEIYDKLRAEAIETLYRELKPKRCQSIDETSGQQCGLPENHYGTHSSGVYIRW